VRSQTDEQPLAFTGDGETRAWALGFPLAKVPRIWLNGVQQTVGIKGVETGKAYYWSKGDPIITQDETATALTSSDVLTGTYIGEFDSVVISANFAEIETRKDVEGGSGIVEDVFDEPGLSGLDAAYQSANAKLQQYGTIGYRLSFTTRRYGLVAGQVATVNLPGYGLDGTEMLIEKVTIQDDNGTELWYQVEAVEGQPQGSWTKLFANMAGKQAYIIRENIGENEVLIYPVSFGKTWAQIDHPNIFKQIYPGETTMPASDLYPSFAKTDRVKFVAWLDPAGVEIGRKPITKQVDLDANRLLSTVFLNPWEANVEIGYLIWIGGVHSDAEVDRQAYAHTKTALEGLQIEKTDTKGW
jgi:hypothetical protein